MAGAASGTGTATEVWSLRGVLGAGCRVDDLGFGRRVQPGGERKRRGTVRPGRGSCCLKPPLNLFSCPGPILPPDTVLLCLPLPHRVFWLRCL